MPPPPHWSDALLAGSYRWLMVAAILMSAGWWYFRNRRDPDLMVVYLGALGGAFLGAKMAYLFAEGWRDWPLPDRWFRLATGKSVLGGLLGGYAGVEGMKWLAGYRKSTGDLFAIIAPLGIAAGRVGCVLQGCCQGRVLTRLRPGAFVDAAALPARWPAAEVEFAFQLIMVAVLMILRAKSLCRGRLFFLYLFVYGLFRFGHEWMRETPVMRGGLSGYQWIALAMAGIGGWMFFRRARRPVEVV
ncbi:prolipoprotein diacylglyceryl transferase family protein [Roseimicrobium sp. ORNL1]|uniref:prolipoprotein diacylglyceryl transferase family protein n=1 Tax=Roseimicrobium sp. ORNL1 TaxID=2711231 RepID=UPI0013E1C802|nr:prolipoprotein diacylglyceryl transferase family protein [Roseimicrobium sp. ORNL1]QIF00707.1 prolipoprotein diacylglyceryl transferase [Roseimicrobium sp. ORNL1]